MLAVCPAALGYDMMGAMLTIATVNVNGLRAAWRKGMPAWIDAAQPDIILMQEVRAPDDIVHGFFSNGGPSSNKPATSKDEPESPSPPDTTSSPHASVWDHNNQKSPSTPAAGLKPTSPSNTGAH